MHAMDTQLQLILYRMQIDMSRVWRTTTAMMTTTAATMNEQKGTQNGNKNKCVRLLLR